ncbi:hypothetical protein GLYMA_10G208000v4 [Glycine max]|uniref:Uncharacterized protein n=1 Tax=Glycine max TaxID=3847 RepID=A0A0R0HWJ5_SOYBN|nr:hypothetical protein GYH30_028636 [Glycine max]KRH34814.1 hypothetical protein GLYMA_10G208000v4 [Glycine max]
MWDQTTTLEAAIMAAPKKPQLRQLSNTLRAQCYKYGACGKCRWPNNGSWIGFDTKLKGKELYINFVLHSLILTFIG